jgi:hypothetical protein
MTGLGKTQFCALPFTGFAASFIVLDPSRCKVSIA